MSINDVLTQEEVQALLHEVETGAIQPGEPGFGDHTEATPYNFSGKERIIRGPLPTLEMIYERFARHFRSTLYTSLRREAAVNLAGVDSLKFADYSASLPTNCGLHLEKMSPLQGTALFLLEPHLVYLLVDSFFGGGARDIGKEQARELTAAELHITRIIIQSATKDFEQAWVPVLRVQMEHKASETNPHFINIASPTETVIVGRFLVQLGSQAGELHVVIPYATIEPIREMLDAGTCSDRAESNGRWSDHLGEGLQSVSVDLRGTIVETELSLREVLKLKPGDVIAVDIPSEVSLYVEGAPMFRGTFGTSRGHNAIRITRPPVSEAKPTAPKEAAGSKGQTKH
jgi:flagellar motor switch protein FliM